MLKTKLKIVEYKETGKYELWEIQYVEVPIVHGCPFGAEWGKLELERKIHIHWEAGRWDDVPPEDSWYIIYFLDNDKDQLSGIRDPHYTGFDHVEVGRTFLDNLEGKIEEKMEDE